MAKQINFEIDEQGDVTVEMSGFHGKGCRALQEAFNNAHGKVTQVKKPEYNRPCVKKERHSRPCDWIGPKLPA